MTISGKYPVHIGGAACAEQDRKTVDVLRPAMGQRFRDSRLGPENGIVCFEDYTKLHSIVVTLSDELFGWFTDDATDQWCS